MGRGHSPFLPQSVLKLGWKMFCEVLNAMNMKPQQTSLYENSALTWNSKEKTHKIFLKVLKFSGKMLSLILFLFFSGAGEQGLIA